MMAYSTCKLHEQRRIAVGSGSTERGTDGHLRGQMLQTLLQDIQGAPRWTEGKALKKTNCDKWHKSVILGSITMTFKKCFGQLLLILFV